MNTYIQNNQKKKYQSPEIIHVELDNEISLALESNPPTGPDEVNNSLQNNYMNDPYNNLKA